MRSFLSKLRFPDPSHALLLAAASFVFVAALAPDSNATTEIPLRFGARSLAMGGTGVAYVDDATAAAINPAGLDGIESFSATLTLAPFVPISDVPFERSSTDSTPGPNQESATVVPLFFAGAGVRALDPLVVGGAVYVATGFGASYDDLAQYDGLDMVVELAVIEAALPISFRVTDEFSVGIAPRFAYSFLTADMPERTGATNRRVEMDLSGVAFPGVLAGVRYAPSEALAFGLTYRSKMAIELEGDGTVTQEFLPGGKQAVHIDSEWKTPHSFRAGAAWAALPKQLLLALEASYTLYDDAVDVLPLAIEFRDLPNTTIDTEVEFHWQDSLAGYLGAEYFVTEQFAARGGYTLAVSATPEEYAGPLNPPPGLIHTVNLGGGFKSESIRVDLGGARGFGGADVGQSANGPPGHYGGGYWLFAGSFSYRR
jgi:long-chain fatty acid transport protein